MLNFFKQVNKKINKKYKFTMIHRYFLKNSMNIFNVYFQKVVNKQKILNFQL